MGDNRVVILGVGNVLLSDEGVGVHIVRKMMTMDIPREIEIIEGETFGFGLMDVVSETDRLVILDAVKGGGPPGSIYRFDFEDLATCPQSFRTSAHQVGILEVVQLSELLGCQPRTTIIGIEPKVVGMGLGLSPEVEAKIPLVIQLALDEVKSYA